MAFNFVIFLLFSVGFYFNNNVKVVTGKSSMAEIPSAASKSYALRYWNEHISSTHLPPPEFFLNKASPLTASESAHFSKLADQNLLSAHLFDFCKKANLHCFQDDTKSNDVRRLIFYSFNTKSNKIATRGYPYTNYLSALKEFTKESPYTRKLFFREAMLKTNTIMPMPNLIDNMHNRPFLPRQISSKLPFSTSKINEIQGLFHIKENDTMIIASTLGDCERAPEPGETKKCVASMEDMIDFATGMLGHNLLVKRMETTKGSNGNIMVGKVKRINGGKINNAVFCHALQFPYLVYYCHSIPQVRVYEADILDPVSKVKINHGVAICHADTSSWSPDHVAFKQFGSAPGKIEVCHWTFESAMIWTTAD